ncbi:unnamed protein product [Mytilus edulis]|uniref:Uncharacterized protein n=1 Tax=Mytilus edulis TaxID=6550 RepID=A0A8S3PRN7_MYTED|nr:unnamed protein product [Mytilus edulis]
MYSSDQTRVENRKIALETAKEKEHHIVHKVVDLMQTLIDNPLQKRRYMVHNIKKLENNIDQNPMHLNTLADLAVLYRNNQLDGKATALDDRINKILNGSDPNDMKEKAVCVLEQGYAVLFEEYTENELEAQQKMEDSFKLIMVEQKPVLLLILVINLFQQKEDFNTSSPYSSLYNDDQFQRILKNPLSAFKYATDELPNDEVVLNRKGTSLWLMFKYRPAAMEDENRKYLDDAAEILSFSITQNPRLHLLAFSTRMNVYFEMSSLNSFPIDTKKYLLEMALKDGKDSIKAKCSERDVCKVAEICQRLAKFPKFYLYGPEAVLYNEYLVIALDYLNQCIRAKGQAYFTAFTMGTIHFDMGEFRTATEWHKRAFLFSDYTLAQVNVRVLCLSILRLCDASKDYTELIHALTFIANKMQDLNFLNNLLPKSLWRDYFGTLWDFLIYLESFPLTTKQVQIAEYLKNVLCEKDPKTARKVKIGQYNSFNITDVVYGLETGNHLLPVIEPEGERTHVMYDYFLIMSQVNSGSIQCLLQHQLRTQMIDDDMTFKGTYNCLFSGDIDIETLA